MGATRRVSSRIRQVRQIAAHLGLGWLRFRVQYAIGLRLGFIRRRTPSHGWNGVPLGDFLFDPIHADPPTYGKLRREGAQRFFFDPAAVADLQCRLASLAGAMTRSVEVADGVCRGHFPFFEHTVLELGLPPDWHANPFTGERAPSDRHWSELSDFGFGDIKAIWEPSRFGFVFALVRAYARSGDERYPEVFWQLVEDWRKQNPPNLGPNWKCGQETAFRVMAWCFGLFGFGQSPSTTAERVSLLAQMIAVSGERIAANLDYALSQKNNHGLSEAAGLWTIGLLFPEFRKADAWRELGRKALETQARELIYDDGSFSQHSVNYHRVMLHDCLWAIRLGELNGRPLSAALRERVAQAGRWLYQLQDEITGRAPCYGPNDGALVLPLSDCDYQDFRPAVQAAHYLATGRRCIETGPWDEDLLWLFGPEALDAPVMAPPRQDWAAQEGGYYTLRSATGFALVRCGTFRHRPGQADLLHTDLWWRGQNVALDPGTFSYNAPSPWDNPLACTAYHNTVAVDGLDQMERAGRFLWLPWARGVVHQTTCSKRGQLAYWKGEHDGYGRLRPPVSHCRGILRLGGERWLVVDWLQGIKTREYRLHWLLTDVPHVWDESSGSLELRTPAGAYGVRVGAFGRGGAHSLVRADEKTPRGWQSPYYGYREPALSLACTVSAPSAVFYTFFSPLPSTFEAREDGMAARGEGWDADISLLPGSLAVRWRLGHDEDELELTA